MTAVISTTTCAPPWPRAPRRGAGGLAHRPVPQPPLRAREPCPGDEPFELFKGFNEIFIVVGLVILTTGWVSALAAWYATSLASSVVDPFGELCASASWAP
jgi:hypothetical protein